MVVVGQACEHVCPSCTTPLVSGLMDDHRVETCRECRGVLIPSGSFAGVVALRRASYAGQDRQPRPIDPVELQRIVDCPHCLRQMEVHPYYGPGNAIVDSCSGCGVIWLDFGEIQMIECAPGRR